MSTYKILEKQFNDIKEKQKRWEFYDNFNSYLSQHEDELMFYECVSSSVSDLNNDIYVDCCLSYIAYNHPLWIYVSDNDEKLFPISVSLVPQILVDRNKYSVNIRESDLGDIKSFIIRNYYLISKYGDMDISIDYFFSGIMEKSRLTEQYLIMEMPIPKTDITGLSTSVWIDGGRKMQHGPRLKFKATNDNNTRTWPSCTISDNPEIKNLPKGCSITNGNLEKIINFSRYNKDLLTSIADGRYSYINRSELDKQLIKIGKNGGPIYPKEMFDKPFLCYDGTPIAISIQKNGKWLIFSSENKSKEAKELFINISKDRYFDYISDNSVCYNGMKYDENGIMDWKSEMKAIARFKQIATNNNFNVKINI